MIIAAGTDVVDDFDRPRWCLSWSNLHRHLDRWIIDRHQQRGSRQADAVATAGLKAAFAASGQVYDSRRQVSALQAQECAISRYRIRRWMRDAALRPAWKRKFVHTADSKHGLPVAKNLLRQFDVVAPNGSGRPQVINEPLRLFQGARMRRWLRQVDSRRRKNRRAPIKLRTTRSNPQSIAADQRIGALYQVLAISLRGERLRFFDSLP